MNSCLKMKRKAKEETSFMKDGRLLLEELIAMEKAIQSVSSLPKA